MYIEEDAFDEERKDADAVKLRRYSVIGNNPSFKQYTKNHDYNSIRYQQQRKEQRVDLEEDGSVLTVSLKDLENLDKGQETKKQKSFFGN